MDYFGINSPADLPKLKEIFDEAVDPTIVNPDPQEISEETSQEVEQTNQTASDDESTDISPMMVSENGELLEGEDDQDKKEDEN